ncbi:mucin-21-like isoform X2 [Littorina saxatilis]|uniref:mucin-21-like isoform X2 n=1 Tax=Littorina saxatilis TaxID=31220 RepID=UPI0038B49D40
MKVPHAENVPTSKQHGFGPGVSATNQKGDFRIGLSAHYTDYVNGIQSPVSVTDTECTDGSLSGVLAVGTSEEDSTGSALSAAGTGQAYGIQSGVSPADTGRAHENQSALTAHDTANAGRAPDVKSGMSPADTGQAHEVQSDMSPANTARVPENQPVLSAADTASTGRAPDVKSGMSPAGTGQAGVVSPGVSVADRVQADGTDSGGCAKDTHPKGGNESCVSLADTGQTDGSLPCANTGLTRLVGFDAETDSGREGIDSSMPANNRQEEGEKARVVSAGGTHLGHDVDCDSDVSAGDTSMKGSDTGQTDGTQAAISAIDTDPGGGRESVDDICLAGDEGSAVSTSDTGQPLCIDSYSQNLQGSKFGVKVGYISSQKNPSAVDLSEFVTSQNESTGTAVPMSVRSQGTAVPMSVRSQKEKTGADMSPSPTSTRVVHTDEDMSVFTTSQKENAGADNSVFAKIKLKNAGADVSAFGTSQKAGSKANVSAFGTSQKAGSKANVSAFGTSQKAGSKANVSAFGTSQKAGSKANVPRADGLVVRSESKIFCMSISKGQIHFLAEGTEEKKVVWPKGIGNKVTGAWDWSPEDSESDGEIPLEGGVSGVEEGTGGTFSSAEEPHAIENGGGVEQRKVQVVPFPVLKSPTLSRMAVECRQQHRHWREWQMLVSSV